ncbi:MAG: NUDIX hydrolase [Cyanobacteria bacterium RUI128]|nr:NUDIX hydrolase [Cyanobacteria bacterium RUI128]
MNFEEKTLKSEYVYRGKVLDVKRDEILVANGNNSVREVVEHPGGVVILAAQGDKLLTVKQFRYPLRETSVELPAGRLEIGEDPDFASKRELEEETGYIAHTWKSLGYIYTTPGFCSEKLYLYYATDLEFVGENPDDDEIIRADKISISDFCNMIQNGEINDSKTICAFYRGGKYIND